MRQQGSALTVRKSLQRGYKGQADLLPPDHLVLRVSGAEQL